MIHTDVYALAVTCSENQLIAIILVSFVSGVLVGAIGALSTWRRP